MEDRKLLFFARNGRQIGRDYWRNLYATPAVRNVKVDASDAVHKAVHTYFIGVAVDTERPPKIFLTEPEHLVKVNSAVSEEYRLPLPVWSANEEAAMKAHWAMCQELGIK